MAKLKVCELIDGHPTDSFEFDVYPFFGISLERSNTGRSSDRFYWRVTNKKGNQLLNFEVAKDSGLIFGVDLITYSGKPSTFDSLSPTRQESDVNLVLVRESEEEQRLANTAVDATDYLHDITFAVSGNKIRLGFYDAPPVKEVQISRSLFLLVDPNDLVVGVEVGNVPAEEVSRMTKKL